MAASGAAASGVAVSRGASGVAASGAAASGALSRGASGAAVSAGALSTAASPVLASAVTVAPSGVAVSPPPSDDPFESAVASFFDPPSGVVVEEPHAPTRNSKESDTTIGGDILLQVVMGASYYNAPRAPRSGRVATCSFSDLFLMSRRGVRVPTTNGRLFNRTAGATANSVGGNAPIEEKPHGRDPSSPDPYAAGARRRHGHLGLRRPLHARHCPGPRSDRARPHPGALDPADTDADESGADADGPGDAGLV